MDCMLHTWSSNMRWIPHRKTKKMSHKMMSCLRSFLTSTCYDYDPRILSYADHVSTLDTGTDKYQSVAPTTGKKILGIAFDNIMTFSTPEKARQRFFRSQCITARMAIKINKILCFSNFSLFRFLNFVSVSFFFLSIWFELFDFYFCHELHWTVQPIALQQMKGIK